MDHAGYGGYAFWAGFAFFAVDREFHCVISRRPAGIEEIAQGGSSSGNAVLQSGAHAGYEPLPFCESDSPGFSFRADACHVQG
jgi:hypothetical protein